YNERRRETDRRQQRGLQRSNRSPISSDTPGIDCECGQFRPGGTGAGVIPGADAVADLSGADAGLDRAALDRMEPVLLSLAVRRRSYSEVRNLSNGGIRTVGNTLAS